MYSYDINNVVEVKGKDDDGSWDLSWWEARIDSFNPATEQYVIEYEQIMVPGEDGKPSSIKDRDDMDVSQLRPPPGNDRIKPITECTLGEAMDVYCEDAWWQGWVKIIRKQEIVICFDTGAPEVTSVLNSELIEGRSEKVCGVFPVRRTRNWDYKKRAWSEVSQAFRKGLRNERVRAAVITTRPPTSRQLDLASQALPRPTPSDEDHHEGPPAKKHRSDEGMSRKTGSGKSRAGLHSSSGQPTGSRPASGQPRQLLASRTSSGVSGQPMGSRQSYGQLTQPQGRLSASSSHERGLSAEIRHDSAAESLSKRKPAAEHSLHPEQSAAAGKHTPVRQEPPHGRAAEPSQKRLIILPSPTQISKAPALAFQTSQALSPLRFAGSLDQMPPSPSTAVAEPDALPASAPPQASAPAGGEQGSMGNAEAKTQPTADRPGDQPLQPRPTDSAVAGNMTGAKSRPDLADQPAAVKQPAAAISGSTKGKGVPGTDMGSGALGSTQGARKSTTAAAPAVAQASALRPLQPPGATKMEESAQAKQGVRKSTAKQPAQKATAEDEAAKLIREKGLTKLSGRTAEHSIDAAEADVIWAAHKATETRLDLRNFLYRKLLPHRPYADIRIWKNANMMKRVSAEAPKKQLKPLPQQQPNALKTQRSGDASTLARRPSLQQRPSQHKPSLQLLPSDDLSKDDPWHETAPKSSQNRTQQIQAVQAPSAAQQLPLGTSRAAAGEAQRTAGSRLAAKEPSKAPGMSVRSASLQEPQENLAAARVNKSLQQESQQASGGMLLSTIEESGLKMGVPAASEPSHIGSMDATDPLFEQYDKLLREELQHQVDPAGLDHNPQPESIVMLGKSIQQLPQQAFAKRKSAVQTVLDAPQQTLPDPVPGHQAAPQDPRLAALKGLHGNPGARRPSPTRPVKPDSAALGVDSGRPKRPRADAALPEEPADSDDLQKPLGTYNLTGTGKRMPKMWSENKYGAKVLCVDNLSCIWTSDRDLRLAIKPIVDYTEAVRIVKEDLYKDGMCYGGWGVMEFDHKQDAEEALQRMQHLYVRTAACPIPRPLLVHYPRKTLGNLEKDQELGHVKDVNLKSHFAQPNSIEFKPAVQWKHLQLVVADCKAQLRKEHTEQLKLLMLDYVKATGREGTQPSEGVPPPPPPEPTPWLFLKGLGRDALEKADVLPEVFTQWGVGASARSIVDPVTRTWRGTAVVRLQSVEQAKHLKQDLQKMVFVMHGTPRALECHSVRLGGPAKCTQAVYDDALSDAFGRSDRQSTAAAAPELMCFDVAQTVEEAYALRLRSLLYHQAEERERLQTLMHQQRKALHKEHEELFDSEVEKLVELNYINQLPAVARQRQHQIKPLRELPARYRPLLMRPSKLLANIQVQPEAANSDAAPLGEAREASKAAATAHAMQQAMGRKDSGVTKTTSYTTRQLSQAAGHSHGIPDPEPGSRPGSSRVVRHVPGGQQGGQASPRQHGRAPAGQLKGRGRGRAPQLPQKRRAPDDWQHGRAVPITGHHERPKHKRKSKQTAVPQPMSMGRVSPGRFSRGRGHRGRKGSSGK